MLQTTPTAEISRSAVIVWVAPLSSIDGRGDAVGALLDLRHLRAGQDLDALLLEALAGEARDLGVLDGQDLRQQLDDRHLGAHGAVERRELDADRARAHDDQRFRHRVRHHRLEIGPDQLPVRLDPGQNTRARAGGDDDVLGGVGPLPQRALRRGVRGLHGGLGRLADLDLARLGDDGLAPDDVDLVLLHQEADAAIELRRDAARALDHGRDIEAERALDVQPVRAGMLHVVVDLGRPQQRLGGNAAPVEADAAEMLALHDRRLEAELRRPDCGDVAAGPAADDDHVIAVSHFEASRQVRTPRRAGRSACSGTSSK